MAMVWSDRYTRQAAPLIRTSVICVTAGVTLSAYPCYCDAAYRSEGFWAVLPEMTRVFGGYPMYAALLLFIGVLENDRFRELLSNRLCRYLGDISFALYAVHFLVIGSFSSWFYLMLHGQFGAEVAFLGAFVSGLGVCVLLADLMTRFVDKPAIRASAWLGDRVQSFVNSRRSQRSDELLHTQRGTKAA